MRHVVKTKAELLAILDDIRTSVERDDSFEGTSPSPTQAERPSPMPKSRETKEFNVELLPAGFLDERTFRARCSCGWHTPGKGSLRDTEAAAKKHERSHTDAQ